MKIHTWIVALSLCLAPMLAQAQSAPKLSNKEPVEIVSDALEVLQNEKKAIFTGNVIATQGAVTMRSDSMTVFYHESADSAAGDNGMGKGIYRIDADGSVLFTTPTETARGDKAVYLVDDETINLSGNVFLTRDKNMLKGTKLVYNLKTGRSVFTGGAVAKGGGGRVRGLFVPGNEGKGASQ